MRWLWIDRFVEFESGRCATAIKTISLTEDYIDEYFVGFPVMTPSFCIEGFAQMGGLLISQQYDFRINLVLAKVSRSRIHRLARPGDQLVYKTIIQALHPDGGLVSGTSHINGELHLEAELTFAQVSRERFPQDFFEPVKLLRMLRIFGMFQVGVDADGKALEVPAHLLEAERRALGGQN